MGSSGIVPFHLGERPNISCRIVLPCCHMTKYMYMYMLLKSNLATVGLDDHPGMVDTINASYRQHHTL